MKLSAWLAGAAVLAVNACAGQQVKDTAMSFPFVMDQSENLQLQRPRLPNTDAVQWTRDNRLYRSVTIDYIQGMSQRSYVFSKPNQKMYRPMLRWALDRAGLLARTPVDARYALQVEFLDLDSEVFGADLAGRSTAVYRLVDRRSGLSVYENTISANFLSIYPRLNEADVADAYDISKDIVVQSVGAYAGYAVVEGGLVELINNNEGLRDFFGGRISEASQATWDDVTQSFVWTAGVGAVLGPLEIVRRQLDPTNYVAFANSSGRTNQPVRGARRGALSEDGFGSRTAGKRARQAGAQMLAQSLTKFVLDLGLQEGAEFVAIMPCNGNEEVEEAKLRMMAQGIHWYAPDCSTNSRRDNLRRDRGTVGLEFTRFK